jgi:hypothetical protein
MHKFVLILIIFFLAAGLAFANPYEVRGKAGTYVVDVAFDKNPVVKGKNHIAVLVSDATSKPVADATVLVDYSMPTLPGKSSMMSYTAPALRVGKKYTAALDLSMTGEWTFAINVTRAGKTEAMTFSLAVR